MSPVMVDERHVSDIFGSDEEATGRREGEG
jgi:hypothetical protein